MKNAILITVDCLRWDFLDLDREERLKNLRRILKNSYLFTDAVSCGPNTPSSFASIMTSTYPLVYGGYSYISEQRPTIAQVLLERGFQTAGFHSNPHLLKRYNYSKGFSKFFDYESIGEGARSLPKLIGNFRKRASERFNGKGSDRLANKLINKIADNTFLFRIAEVLRRGRSPYEEAAVINNRVKDWIKNDLDTERRFFLWVHYMETHLPYILQKGTLKISKAKISDLMYRVYKEKKIDEADKLLLKGLYLQQLEYLDHYLGDLLKYLDSKQLLDETVLIIVSDHGEAFFEHGYHGHAKTYGYDGCRLHQPVLRVPFIIYNKSFESKIYPKKISLLDLSPTLLDLLKVPQPDGFLGESVFSETRSPDKVIISEYRNETSDGKKYSFFAFIVKNKKYIYDSYKKRTAVFNIDKDPQERKDIFAEDPQHQRVLTKLLSEHNDLIRSTDQGLPTKEVDAELKERLRALGYI